ncbi:MAG: hypothetical protein GY800_10090 [Planctomycetes bacterium]|nr:hypothetical protein [Planctomycetota bacterium]
MQVLIATLIALNMGLYELPRVEHTQGVEGARQAAWDVELYLDRAREAVGDAYVRHDISAEVLHNYEYLDENTCHYQHLFVMAVLFYDEAPIEDPYGLMVTKASEEMLKRLVLLDGLLFFHGVEIPEPPESYVTAVSLYW